LDLKVANLFNLIYFFPFLRSPTIRTYFGQFDNFFAILASAETMIQFEWSSFYKVKQRNRIEILNAFLGEYQAEEIDTEYYNLRKIKLLDICHDKEETLVSNISQKYSSKIKF
jgi:hypothetical protein